MSTGFADLLARIAAAGSLFFSHVNDPGCWLVKSYLGVDTPTLFRTWSVLETVISVVGLIFILVLSHVL